MGKPLSTLWAIAAVALVSGSLYYTAAAFVSKSQDSTQATTLDGLAFVKESDPAEYGAIQYIKLNLPEDAAILEGVGEWFNAGLISRSTGHPTIYNWPGTRVTVARAVRMNSPERDQRRGDDIPDDGLQGGARASGQVRRETTCTSARGSETSTAAPDSNKFPEFMDTLFQQNDVALYGLRR